MTPTRREDKGVLSEGAFDRARFLSPALAYAPIYTWMWNARVTREETDRQLAEMRRLGIRRFYILPMPKSFRPTSFPTPLEPEYLTDGYFDAYAYAVAHAHELGMELWLYDEGGWPSGSACGQVVLENPDLVAQTIKVTKLTLKAGEPYAPTEQVEAAFWGEERVRAGQTFQGEVILTEYRRAKGSFPHISSADSPDVTKKGAAETFLKLTHDAYLKALGSLPAQGIGAIFTDEPTAPRPFPYTEEIKSLFRERFGEELEGYLPLLTGRVKATGKGAEIKIEFYKEMSRLYCERFLEKEKAWTHAAGALFVGHLDKEDEANGSITGGSFSLLSALRVFDVPGVDAIRRQIFPPKGRKGLYGENKHFPRLASSAAAQTGGRHALTESFAVYGAGLSYEEMRYVLSFQAMRGVNLFNLMIVPYGRTGYAQAGLLPHFTEESYPDLAAFNLYLSRLSYLFSLGERSCKVALYYPIEDGIAGEKEALDAYERAGKLLEKKRVLFDVADDELLKTADKTSLKKGVIASGRAAYDTLILPPCHYLSEEGKAAIRTFLQGGGRALTLSQALADELGAFFDPTLASLPSSFPLEDAEGITYAESVTEDGTLSFLMNEAGAPKSITLFASKKIPYLILPSEGKILIPCAEKGKFEITLASGEIACLLYTDRKIEAERVIAPTSFLPLDAWSYRPTHRFVIGERTERISLDERERPLPQGETGFADGFSGSVLYRTLFSLPQRVKAALLDLGEVSGAASVSLNGTQIGLALAPPYRFEIPLSLLAEQNELAVTVTNTAANEYASTRAFDAYRPWQLGGYFAEELTFCRDSIGGGLEKGAKIFYE